MFGRINERDFLEEILNKSSGKSIISGNKKFINAQSYLPTPIIPKNSTSKRATFACEYIQHFIFIFVI
jgi:hypothetical protein